MILLKLTFFKSLKPGVHFLSRNGNEKAQSYAIRGVFSIWIWLTSLDLNITATSLLTKLHDPLKNTTQSIHRFNCQNKQFSLLVNSTNFKRKKRLMKKYLVSYPLIALSIVLAFLLMMTYYYFQHLCDKTYPESSIFHTIMKLLPSIIYSCVVIPINLLYKYAAVKLTDWG